MRRSQRTNRDSEMNDEMRFHIDMEAAELVRMGVPENEARRRALATFGGVRRYVEEGHESRGGAWLDDLRRDIRYSVRSLARSPGYTAVVVLTLALGIAANTSIFSVANSILFKSLPYRDPSRLMVLWDGLDWVGIPEAWVTGPEVVRLRRETTLFEGFATVRTGSITIGGDRGVDPQQVPQSSVSANFFQLLGAGPELGRGFAAGEDAPGAPRVAVISRRLWTQRYGADPGLIGKTIAIDGTPTTVIGVLPATFRFAAQSSLSAASGDIDVYTTMTDTLGKLPPGNHSIGVLARVRGTANISAALGELSALSRRIDADRYRGQGFKFVPVLLQERMVRDVRPALLALLAAVGMLMLIMCANLAVLALVRAARRERELTVRRAIGASQSRVTRQILTETILLSFGGAVVGTLLGTLALRGLLAMAPPGLPRRGEIGIDLTVLAATLGAAIVVGLAIGFAPIVHSVRSDIAAVLREKAPSRAGGRVRRALVLAQLALSMILLAGTGLLLGSFVKLLKVDPGFEPRGVLTIELMAGRTKYASGQPVIDAFARQIAALRSLPGVTSVAATAATPLSAGADQSGATFPTSPPNTGDRQHDGMLVDNAPVTAGYFKTMSIALIGGQEFDASHRDSLSSRVAVIDDILAEKYFPKGNAVGQPVTLDGDTLRVIGVARHVRMYNLQEEGRGQLWVPHAYNPYRYLTLVVRTAGDPLAIADAARRAIRALDPEQPIIRTGTMTDVVRQTLAERRLVLTLVGTFAGAAVLLAALGLYGVTASSVAQRTRELGIRMALGANRKSVIWNVLGEPTRLVAIGLVIGLAGTYFTGRAAQRLLYGVSPTDPLTLGAVSLLLLGVGIVAAYIPARRATRVDPIIALRAD